MASYATLARPYAQAVFQVAQSSNSEDNWAATLPVLKAVMLHDGVSRLVSDPTMTAKEWESLFMDILQSACAAEVSALGEHLLQFVRLVIEARRQLVLPEIADVYKQLLADLRGIQDVSLTSAFPLSDEKQAFYIKSLKKQFDSDLKVTFLVDSSLIGGAIVRSGDRVMDGSIRGKLNRLAQQLLGSDTREGV